MMRGTNETFVLHRTSNYAHPSPASFPFATAMRSSAGKRRGAASASASSAPSSSSAVEQLRLLRDFAGPGYSERQLTVALRAGGYDVERAAEVLLLASPPSGSKSAASTAKAASEGQPSKPPPSSHLSSRQPAPPKAPPAAATATATGPDRHPTARKDPRETLVVDSSDDEHEHENDSGDGTGCAPKPKALSSSRRSGAASLKSPPSCAGKSPTPPPASSAADAEDVEPRTWYLLCERWISDGFCTVRNGRVSYREDLELEAMGDKCVRFRASGDMQGRLPDALASFVAPLLREQGTIRLEGSALMEVERADVGTHMPLSLTVFVNPQRLFRIGDRPAGAAAGSPHESGDDARRTSCVFRLLQWAEYGDALPLEEPASNNKGDRSSPAAAETEVAAEAYFEEDEQGGGGEFPDDGVNESLASPSSDWARTLPEADDPQGWRGGIALKPYQRQALHWMLQREQPDGGWDRSEWERQLQFVAELARDGQPGSGSSSAAPRPVPSSQCGRDVVCECGPVLVSDRAREEACTWDGRTVHTVNHPLWKPRYLASAPDLKHVLCVYVNEALQIATHEPPPPPAPCSGGILADAMGLGKTVMLLSLILKSKELREQEQREQQQHAGSCMDVAPTTTLVVAKLSLLPQWEDEIRSKTSLTCVVYYGSSAKNVSLEGVDVVLTTYGTLQGELSRSQPLLLRHSFLRVILDEAHCVRNHRTVASQVCCRLEARHRWCASGTVFQNSLDDIYGMVKFLRHEPWCHGAFWKGAITRPSEQQAAPAHPQNQSTQSGREPTSVSAADTTGLQLALDRVRRMLSPLMLRRTKHSLSRDGTPILTLPPVETRIVPVTLSDREREFYNAVLARSVEVFDGYVESGTVHKSYFQIFSLIQRLRQVCDHISLTVRSRLRDPGESPENGGAEMSVTADTESADPPNDALGGRFLEGLLSQFCKSSPKRRADRSSSHAESPSKRQKENFLSQVANTLANAVRNKSTHVEEECPICLELPKIEDAVLAPCAHIFCRSCLLGYLRDRSVAAKSTSAASIQSLVQFPDGDCPCCNKRIDAKRIIAMSKSNEGFTSQFLTEARQAPSQPSSQESLATDTTLARQILREALDAESSSKMTAIFQELDNVWSMDPGSKVLIFSHYLGFLDLLESRLRREGIAHFRLDGSLSLAQRMQVLDEFRHNSSTKLPSYLVAAAQTSSQSYHPMIHRGTVLLMSMSAGGEGLNLTAASTCFLTSPWWHVEKENQCLNRIHRIGQTAAQVRVRKFVVVDSVEERIIELQQRKIYMAGEIYSDEGRHEGAAAGGARLSLEEFRHLFRR